MTKLQRNFLNLIYENEWEVFNRQMILDSGLFTTKQINAALRYLLNSSEIVQIEKGKYRRKTFSDEKVIGCFLIKDGGIAYWTALNMHGLTEQFSNKMYLQTSQRKKDIEVLNSTYRFIQVNKNKITGYNILGYGNLQYKITDIEKTIFDCFDLPQYSGGLIELIRALNRTKLNSKKMINYAKAINNKAAIKRIAYLSELFNKNELKSFIEYAKKERTKNYDLLDVFGYNEGQYISEWNIRLNINEQDIIDIANSIY